MVPSIVTFSRGQTLHLLTVRILLLLPISQSLSLYCVLYFCMSISLMNLIVYLHISYFFCLTDHLNLSSCGLSFSFSPRKLQFLVAYCIAHCALNELPCIARGGCTSWLLLFIICSIYLDMTLHGYRACVMRAPDPDWLASQVLVNFTSGQNPVKPFPSSPLPPPPPPTFSWSEPQAWLLGRDLVGRQGGRPYLGSIPGRLYLPRRGGGRGGGALLEHI